jgi:hypothetical protein
MTTTAMTTTAVTTSATITIRPAFADDRAALIRLAALDSSPVPTSPVLLAEVDEEARAALSLADGSVVADPFFRTLDLVALLRAHAAAISHERHPLGSRRPVGRFRPHLASG